MERKQGTEVQFQRSPEQPTRKTGALTPGRIAGLCYLLVVVGGIFAEVFVRTPITGADAASTWRSIEANEGLWRAGIAVHLSYLILALVANVILYGLFRPWQATLAGLALLFSLADIIMEALLQTFLYVPLVLLDEASAFSADQAWRESTAYLAIRLFFAGWGFALFLFSGFCILTGVLILRSRLVPLLLGWFMIAAGAAYFSGGLLRILTPSFFDLLVPWILLPSFIGELSLSVWLAVKGVAPRHPPTPTTST